MPASRRALVLCALAGLAAGPLLGGCVNPFLPRTPEPPSEAGVLTDYSDPDSTLATLARAIEAKAGTNARSSYIAGLADSVADGQYFFAYFDPGAAAKWQSASGGTPPAIWGVDREESFFIYMSNLVGRDYSFSWLPDVQHPNDEDLGLNLKLLHRRYLLEALPDKPGGLIDTLAIGYADMTFLKSRTADKWVITRWQDRVDPIIGVNPGNQSLLSFSARRLEAPY